MKIAYLIAAHTDTVQFSRLVKALYVTDSTYFYVHIDKKYNKKEFENSVNGIKNVFFIKNRVSTYWGGYSQCIYQQSLIEECLLSIHKFDRIFFLSGLDYPLWSNGQILHFLEQNQPKEFIMGMNISTCDSPAKMPKRIQQYHYRDWPFLKNATIRRLLYGVTREIFEAIGIRKSKFINENGNRLAVFGGSSWWCVSYECLKYINEAFANRPAIRKYIKTCLAPDELYIQTLVFNSPFGSKALLYEGEYPGLVGLTPLHYIEYDGKISTYTEKDYDKLMSSGKMFVRKLQSGISDGLIELIDQHRAE